MLASNRVGFCALWLTLVWGGAVSDLDAQDALLSPRLTNAVLWEHQGTVVERAAPMRVLPQEAGASLVGTVAAAGLGSVLGGGVGFLVGAGTGDDLGDLALGAFVGSWAGGAMGAALVTDDAEMSILGSTVGTLLGVALTQREETDSGWLYFGVQTVVTALIATAR